MLLNSLFSLAILMAAAPLAAQANAEPTAEDRAREREERVHNDWAYLSRYREANAALTPTPGKPRIVFLGDSITEGWVTNHPAFFKPGRVGRGISGRPRRRCWSVCART